MGLLSTTPGAAAAAAAALVAALVAAPTAAVPAAAAPARLSIETCKPGFAGEAFAVNADGTVTQGGQCVGFDSTSLLLAKCSGGPEQVWSFQPDGTVHNKADTSNCWNVIGGGTTAGSTVGMYECGVRAVAANDIFWPLPSAGTIRANESGLCLSSAAPPSTCDGDECCSLNGVWAPSGGGCTCYPPWTGANCSSLDVLPVPPVQGYGMAPNVTSWGGNVIADAAGTFHLYVSEMANHCPLNTWGSNSRCTHATAKSIEGPYTFSDVAVDIWCHNAHVMTQIVGGKTTYALFHIGDGTGGNPKNCSASAVAVGSDGDAAAVMPRSPAATGSTLHTASSPYGPWTPVVPSPPSCNNPAPYLHPNGTWYLLCDGSTIYTAPGLAGPWTALTRVAPSAGHGVAGTYEDPFLWMDARGNWHVIWHVYTTDVPDTCVNSTVSGHYFSRDGLTWTASPFEPYGNEVHFTDGSSMLVSTRERPKLLFNAAGEPTHLVNGVCGGSSFCAPTPCVNCKYDFWDFTLIQPLNA